MNEYKTSKDPANLLSVSEQYFDLTNEMVDKAQTMVDIMAYLLYIVLNLVIMATNGLHHKNWPKM